MFSKKGVPKNLAKFTGKHLCHSFFLNKVPGLRPETLVKRIPWHRCFPVNFVLFSRVPFLQNTSGRLLLVVVNIVNCTSSSTSLFMFPVTCLENFLFARSVCPRKKCCGGLTENFTIQ